MILATFLTNAIAPFAKIFGWLLAFFYAISHNYGIAIVLLTLLTMIVVFPLTRKGTRSMMQMQLLQPELMKLRNKYKKKPGMSAEERREITAKQQEEMMALYRENGVSPTGGCLPMFLQFPVFIVLYNTIRGMTHTMTVGTGSSAHVVADPEFVPKNTALYHNLIHDGGKMYAFGLNLADSVRTPQAHWVDVIPYVIVILIAVVLQYVSIWQITNRNPTAGANQQMQQIQKFMPLIFVFIYIEFPAAIGVYFIVSSAFRIGQQEWMYKKDPQILESVRKLKEMKAKNPPPPVQKPKGWRERLAALSPATDPSLEPSEEAVRSSDKSNRKPSQGSRPGSGNRPTGNKASSNRQGSGKPGQPGGARPSSRTHSGPARGQSGQAGKSGQAPRPAQGKRPSSSGRPSSPTGAPPSGRDQPVQGQGSKGERRSNANAARPTDGPANGSRAPSGSKNAGNGTGSEGRSTSGNGSPESAAGEASTGTSSPRRRGRPR